MIQPAQLYADKLKIKFAEIAYDERFKFLYGCSYVEEYVASKSTWNEHEFAIIQYGDVVGYIRYGIDRSAYNVRSLFLVNFSSKPNYMFSRDIYTVFKDIFDKFGFNKISFTCICGNPIESTYDKIVKKYNGRIVGIKKADTVLADGKFYDVKLYEIHKKDYLLCKGGSKI